MEPPSPAVREDCACAAEEIYTGYKLRCHYCKGQVSDNYQYSFEVWLCDECWLKENEAWADAVLGKCYPLVFLAVRVMLQQTQPWFCDCNVHPKT